MISWKGSVALTGTPQLPPDFDPDLYLPANPDVKAAGVDAATRYLNFGRVENRKLRPPKHS